MKKYLVPEIEFDLRAGQDVLSASYDKTDFTDGNGNWLEENLSDDIF